MDWIVFLITAISSLFTYGAIVLFLHCFYDPRIQWNRKKAILLIIWGILIQLILMFELFPNDAVFIEGSYFTAIMQLLNYSILDIVVACGIIFYDYGKKKIRAILRFFWLYIICDVCITLIMIGTIQYLFPQEIYNEELLMSMDMQQALALLEEFLLISDLIELLGPLLIGIFFGMVFFYLYYRLYKPGIFIRCGVRERVFGWIYSICLCALSLLLSYSATIGNQLPFIIFIGSFLLLAAVLPIFIYYSRISGYYRQRTKYQEDFMEIELDHFRQYKLAQEETRRFRHDVKNDLLCIHELLTSGKTEEAGAYLKNLVEITDALGSRHVTGDEILDSILAAKGAVMEENGIDFHLDGVLAGGLPWKPVDICSVFANALDNAIEACQCLPRQERNISMQIKSTPQFWFVRIENPVKEDIDVSMLFQKKGGYTSKSDARHHGIGTYSIKHTSETYGGIVNANCVDRRFTLEIMLAQ